MILLYYIIRAKMEDVRRKLLRDPYDYEDIKLKIACLQELTKLYQDNKDNFKDLVICALKKTKNVPYPGDIANGSLKNLYIRELEEFHRDFLCKHIGKLSDVELLEFLTYDDETSDLIPDMLLNPPNMIESDSDIQNKAEFIKANELVSDGHYLEAINKFYNVILWDDDPAILKLFICCMHVDIIPHNLGYDITLNKTNEILSKLLLERPTFKDSETYQYTLQLIEAATTIDFRKFCQILNKVRYLGDQYMYETTKSILRVLNILGYQDVRYKTYNSKENDH